MTRARLPEAVLRAAPAYLLDVARVEARYAEFLAAFGGRFPGLAIGYSYKTNWMPFLCRRLHELGAFAEVVSSLEYELARRLGLGGDRIVFNGPGKSPAAIARALDEGALVHLDSAEEVTSAVDWLARRHGSGRARLGLRVCVDLSFGRAAPKLSRFGLGLEEGELETAADRLFVAGVDSVGLHVHVSSKQRTTEVFSAVASTLGEAARRLGPGRVAGLDVGGGFGVAPQEIATLAFPSLDDYALTIQQALEDAFPGYRELPFLIEPGIAMVGDAFDLIAPVRAVRRRNGRIAATIGASVQTVRPTRHRHRLPIMALAADGEPKRGRLELHDLVGYTCMEDDVVAEAVELPTLGAGDLVRIGNVGAYTWVFKPRFIRSAPPVWARIGEEWRQVQSAETIEEFAYGGVE